MGSVLLQLTLLQIERIDAEAECIGNVVDCPVATDNAGVASDVTLQLLN